MVSPLRVLEPRSRRSSARRSAFELVLYVAVESRAFHVDLRRESAARLSRGSFEDGSRRRRGCRADRPRAGRGRRADRPWIEPHRCKQCGKRDATTRLKGLRALADRAKTVEDKAELAAVAAWWADAKAVEALGFRDDDARGARAVSLERSRGAAAATWAFWRGRGAAGAVSGGVAAPPGRSPAGSRHRWAV